MPVTPTYPGVYIEEIPSGVRTITGVATSIAAFIGWARKGPTDAAGLVLSWADYERQYGGLDARGRLGYAVSQFFANGGQQAYIVRLVATPPPPPPVPPPPPPPGPPPPVLTPAAVATRTVDALTLTAKSPGAWANDYGIAIKNQAGGTSRFRLQVVYVKPGSTTEITVESFENLSMANPDSQGRFVEDVIKNESQFVTASVVGGPPAPAPPGDTSLPSPKLQHGDDGSVLLPNSPPFESAVTAGVSQLDHVNLFNLLCVPGETTPALLSTLEGYCHDHRAFLIADCPEDATFSSMRTGPDPTIAGAPAVNAAIYFPWVIAPDPLSENRPTNVPPSGFVAGIYARTDATRGVWKAPAGTDASLTGVIGVKVPLTDTENGVLNPQAINCIRNFDVYGTVIWGARTLRGNDEIGSEWKYIPVRRTALFIEESLYRALKWVVFEPNDEPLWAQIRLNVGAFMHDLFRQGAFQGKTPQDAYFVKCDKETTTQSDINRGIVNIVVGFAPLKPAEFVIIKIQQMAGQIET
jgi:phage tail sheath protein FI